MKNRVSTNNCYCAIPTTFSFSLSPDPLCLDPRSLSFPWHPVMGARVNVAIKVTRPPFWRPCPPASANKLSLSDYLHTTTHIPPPCHPKCHAPLQRRPFLTKCKQPWSDGWLAVWMVMEWAKTSLGMHNILISTMAAARLLRSFVDQKETAGCGVRETGAETALHCYKLHFTTLYFRIACQSNKIMCQRCSTNLKRSFKTVNF